MRLPPISEEQKREAIEAYNKAGGNKAQAARDLGLHVNTFKDRYKAATLHKSVARLEPFIPDGQKLRGVSSLYKVDTTTGEKTEVMQWVKTNEDLARQLEVIKATAEGFKQDIPREKPFLFTGHSNADLLSQYTITDYHIGMMAKFAEVGEEWNSEIAVDLLVKWFANLISRAPNSQVAVLAQLGDFLHFDGMDAVTPTSKHILDADTRYSIMVNMAVKVLRRVINMLLEKHEHVHVIMAEGNHDMASSIWLRAMLSDKYEDEPRVTVDNTHLPFYAYEWGSTSLFYHHGHKNKMSQVSKTFAGMFREMYGRTEFSYVHMGHYHHIDQKEDNLMVVEQHPTMATKDAYSARGGYLSKRAASLIVYHKKYGEMERHTTRPEMLQ